MLEGVLFAAGEQDAIALVCLGYTNREIGGRLGKSRSTIQAQLNNAYKKLGVRNRVELHALFIDWDFSAFGRASHQRASPTPAALAAGARPAAEDQDL